MIQLRLTQKAQKAAGIRTEQLVDVSETKLGLGSWTVNLFVQNRRKVLIFVNDKTLYSFILTGIRKEHYAKLPKCFGLGLLQLLEADGFTEKEIAFLIAGVDQISYTKTNSRKVLGTVNNLVWHYQHSISSHGGLEQADVGGIIHRVNRMPQNNLDWLYAIDAVRTIVESA